MAASETAVAAVARQEWHPATRVAFRFCFLYFGLYILLTQMLTSLLLTTTNDSGAFELDQTRPVQAAVTWVAAHVFHIGHALVTFETGSGDRVYDWVELACIFALAAVGTVVWSLVDWKRPDYTQLFCWLHLIARFALAATLLTYGAVKIFPLQMMPPPLLRLLEPYGHFSPMGVLWSSIGSAPGYEFFAGSMEFAAGVLLLFPRTAMLGAMVGFADGVQVFMLNMAYDVPVKLLSFHLIPLSLLVLAPDGQRLCATLFSHGPAPVSRPRELFATRRANRWSLGAQTLFAVYLIGGNLYGAGKTYREMRPVKSPLYGIWNVRTFALDGRIHPPSLTDQARWRRVIFDRPTGMVIQDMADGARGYRANVDVAGHAVKLTLAGDKAWHADFTYGEPNADEMLLAGTMDGQRIEATLERMDLRTLPLLSRGFHWVQDYPYNR